MLKLALANSMVETKLVRVTSLPQGAVFYPTREEFADPIKYIASIEKEAARTGICKIVPPSGWKPPFAIDLEDEQVTFDTRKQKIHELEEGHAYGDGRVHTFRSYRASADKFRRRWFHSRGLDPDEMTSDEIEQEYWRIVEAGGPNVEVEYANDLDITEVGSGFPRSTKRFASQANKGKEKVDFNDEEYYRNTGWNLNNLPDAYGSLLRHLDNYMSSINYHHLGAKKRWYGIPSSDAENFEAAMRTQVPERFREEPDLLLHLTTMVPPSTLQAKGVEVFTLVQEPGEIILTFPKAYHGGFSEGFNCNEAVNFVLPNWIDFGRECVEMYQLRRLFHEERDYKKTFIAHGLESVEELSGDVMLDEQSMQVDDLGPSSSSYESDEGRSTSRSTYFLSGTSIRT
ncbi:hypothetical protein BBJ29_006123 [Phytophthora kernoviae]|uniref:JmjC domain-containing protein n=1 Tax=Phytophthora kernoviae TaxID=325452 RepID=A0A3F2RIR3_9STRA|nr:hypothetical protein BBJ29_006123 [Phytophthora kernoviae]RLN57861.1 hypothetical protein BBP00_00007310 [Phytophthora kernoviae]